MRNKVLDVKTDAHPAGSRKWEVAKAEREAIMAHSYDPYENVRNVMSDAAKWQGLIVLIWKLSNVLSVRQKFICRLKWMMVRFMCLKDIVFSTRISADHSKVVFDIIRILH